MSTFYLLNTTFVGTQRYLAGAFIDDTVHPAVAIAAAGGTLWPSSDPAVAAAAAQCQAYRRNKGSRDEEVCHPLMHAAAAASLKAGTSTALATGTTPGAMSAADKKFLAGNHAAGTGLTDAATQTIASPSGIWGQLPVLSQNGALTLGTTGAIAGDQFQFTRTSVSAFSYAIINGGPGAGTMITYAASKLGTGQFQFDGTNWALQHLGVQ
jgi:hypothetical protein